MTGVQGDLIQIVDYQTYLAQQVLNVYHYRITTIGTWESTQYSLLLDQFFTNVITPVTDMQSDDLLHTTTELRNLSNNLDIVTRTNNRTGQIVSADSNNMPSYVSLGFKLVRESLSTRNGYKRFAGVTEGQVAGNTYTFIAGVQAAVQAALAADLTVDAARIVAPVIVQRPINPPVGSAYTYSNVGSAVFVGLGSQNSRKQGRGI